MGGVINIMTSRGDAPDGRSQGAVRQPRQPQGGLSAPATSGASSAWCSTAPRIRPTAIRSSSTSTRRSRGARLVDKNASVEFRTFNLKVRVRRDRQRAGVHARRAFPRGADNGKASTIDGTDEKNDTTLDQRERRRPRRAWADGSELQATLFSDFETFRSNFLAVPAATPPRSIGRMTLNQRVPERRAVGGMVQWSRAFGSRQSFTRRHRLALGRRRQRGGRARRGDRHAGDAQARLGRHAAQPRPVRAGRHLADRQPDDDAQRARLDQWRNYDGHNLEAAYPSGMPTANNAPTLPERDDTVVQPARRGALSPHRRSVSVWGDIGAGFRAPTLNELYRQFRVGTVLTLANNQLGPERLVGGELGVSVRCRGRTSCCGRPGSTTASRIRSRT